MEFNCRDEGEEEGGKEEEEYKEVTKIDKSWGRKEQEKRKENIRN